MGYYKYHKINKKMGFYYNQQPGFYYNQQPGFYYNQEGFYYDQKDGEKNFAADWKKLASSKVSAVMIANNHKPGATENRILAQISAERIAYEAAEIFMNSTPGNDKLSAADIKKKLFAIAVKAIDG